MDIKNFMPNGFKLRRGAGRGDPSNGMCYMEVVALIAGEDVYHRPKCACPIITKHGIRLNDWLSVDERQNLLPLVWATAGTFSPEHELSRKKIFGLAACEMGRLVLPIFEKKHPDNNRPRRAIEAAESYWRDPNDINKNAASAAAAAAVSPAVSPAAAAGVYSAYSAGAPAAAYAAACAAACAADAAKLRQQINDIAIQALRDAIEAGPNGGIPQADCIKRIESYKQSLGMV